MTARRYNERIQRAKESIGKHDYVKTKSTKLKPEYRTQENKEDMTE